VPGVAGYTYSLLPSISERDLHEWEPFSRPGDALMDPRFRAAVERSLGGEANFWSVVFGGPAALSLFPVDGLLFVGEPWKQSEARKAYPGCGLGRDRGTQEAHFLPACAAVEARRVRRIDKRTSVPGPARVERPEQT
jgi:hypothetical protein